MSDLAASAGLAVRPVSSLGRWRIVLLLMLFAALGHFNRVGISVAGSEVFIPKLGLNAVQMGWVYTTFLIVYTAAMLPGGWIIDRLGPGFALTILGLGMGSFVMLTGVTGWVRLESHQLWIALLFIRGLAGSMNAPLHPGAARVVSNLMTPSGRATANGMVTAGALIGIAACYPVFGWLIDRLGWQGAFIVSGLALFLYGVFWRTTISGRVDDLMHLPAAATVNRPAGLTRPDDVDSPQEESQRGNLSTAADRWRVLTHADLWLVTLSYAAFGYFQYLFFYWMSYYFESVLHVEDVASRRASFLIMLAQGGGMAIGGLSTDIACRWLGTTLGRRCIVMLGMGLSGLFGLLGVQVSGMEQVTLCLALAMGALGMCEGVFWTTATDIGGRQAGFAGAFMNTGGNLGGLVSPVLTPSLAQSVGWTGAIAIACLINLLGGLVWFLIHPHRHVDQSEALSRISD